MRSAPARAVLRFAVLISVGLSASCSTKAPDPASEAQRVLERRLLAPCCWRQTLEDHDSPVAGTLRAEISSRLAAGESAEAIEASLVSRHGAQIQALPPGGDPRWIIGSLVLVTLAGTLIGIGFYVRPRRSRRLPRKAGDVNVDVATPPPTDLLMIDRYEQQLDDELLEL
jgi:cytochrome c-type biogenesis protein CcmH